MSLKLYHNRLLLALLAICFASSLQGQTISTIAGNGSPSYAGDGGPSTLAKVNAPRGVATDAAGNIYFTDYDNHRIRKINASTGIITTIAGTGLGAYLASQDGGPATAAWIKWPYGIALDAAGNIYFSDHGNSIVRKISTSGIITTIAGIPSSPLVTPPAASGDGGPATAIGLGLLCGVAVDAAGNVLVADSWHHRVRRINTTTGIISTVAGAGLWGAGGDGGPATAAAVRLNEPIGVAVDATGNIYIAENNRVRKINTSGIISTFAGVNLPYGSAGDGGPATAAQLYYPKGIATDAAGNVFISDWNNHRIRKINTSGIINTLAGTGTAGFSGDGLSPSVAQVNFPMGLAVRSDGDVFIADVDNNRIRRIKIGNDPYFIWGASKSYLMCPGEFGYIDTLLSVDDIDIGQTENWTPARLPTNGTLVSTYSTTSTGSTMTPVMLSYAPFTGFTGLDTFSVRVTDGTASDTIVIYVDVQGAPNPGAILGLDSVCPGNITVLTDTISGGTWTSSAPAIATVSASGVVTGVAPGTFTITYTVSNFCGTMYTTYDMRVIATVPCVSQVNGTNGLTPNVSIVPNPNNGTFTITAMSALAETMNVEIYDAVGRKVMEKIISSNKATEISLAEPNGVYIISISSKGEKIYKKVDIRQ